MSCLLFQVTVLALSHTVEAPPTRCDANSLNPASQISKYYLVDYIDSLSPAQSLANHSLGLQAAFSVIPQGISVLTLLAAIVILGTFDQNSLYLSYEESVL